jgi:hypothetical protein
MNAIMLQQELQAASEAAAAAAAGPPLGHQALGYRDTYGMHLAKQQFQQYWSDSALQQQCAAPQDIQYTSMDC